MFLRVGVQAKAVLDPHFQAQSRFFAERRGCNRGDSRYLKNEGYVRFSRNTVCKKQAKTRHHQSLPIEKQPTPPGFEWWIFSRKNLTTVYLRFTCTGI